MTIPSHAEVARGEVRVDPDGRRAVVTDLEVTDADAVRYLADASQRGPGEAVEAARRALGVGAAVLQRVAARGDADYLRARAAEVILKVEGDIQALRRDLEGRVREVLGPDAPGSAAQAILGRFGEVQKAIQDELSRARQELDKRREVLQRDVEGLFSADGRLGRILKDMAEFGGRVQAEFEKAFGATGRLPSLLDERLAFDRETSPFTRFREGVRKEIAGLREEIAGYRAALVKEAEVQEAEAAGTRKGFTFEDELEERLGGIARPFGDEVERVSALAEPGGEKKGDFVYALAGGGARVVIEAKDEPMESLPAWKKLLDSARALRNASYAILVTRESAQLQAQVGAFAEYEEDKLFTSADLLEVAVKWARIRARLAARATAPGVDAAAVEVELERARSALKALIEAKKGCGAIETGVTAIRGHLDDAQKRVGEALDAARRLLLAPRAPDAR
ncbi:MAG: DUF2130 domain-containing protein [Planctomycetales bacterium]|nr:DUF2130 domain-containing protein [Planctomycetales bacterium]